MIPQSPQVRLVKRMTDMRPARRKWHRIFLLTRWPLTQLLQYHPRLRRRPHQLGDCQRSHQAISQYPRPQPLPTPSQADGRRCWTRSLWPRQQHERPRERPLGACRRTPRVPGWRGRRRGGRGGGGCERRKPRTRGGEARRGVENTAPVNHSNRSCKGGRREGSKYPALTVFPWIRRALRVSLLLFFWLRALRWG